MMPNWCEFEQQYCCGTCANYCFIAEECGLFNELVPNQYYGCCMWEPLRKLEPGEYDGR